MADKKKTTGLERAVATEPILVTNTVHLEPEGVGEGDGHGGVGWGGGGGGGGGEGDGR